MPEYFFPPEDPKPILLLSGAKFTKVVELYSRWKYQAKQKKKIEALSIVLIANETPGNVSETEMVSTRRAVTDVSELVDGARIWHCQRGEGTLVWWFDVGREDKQYTCAGFGLRR